MTTLLPRGGDVVLVEEGLGIVRFVGDVDIDKHVLTVNSFDHMQKGNNIPYYTTKLKDKHIGIEIPGNNTFNGSDNGTFNGSTNNALFIPVDNVIRTITSEEILGKLAVLYDIVTGRTENSHFVECSKYNAILNENQKLQESVSALYSQICEMQDIINEYEDETLQLQNEIYEYKQSTQNKNVLNIVSNNENISQNNEINPLKNYIKQIKCKQLSLSQMDTYEEQMLSVNEWEQKYNNLKEKYTQEILSPDYLIWKIKSEIKNTKLNTENDNKLMIEWTIDDVLQWLISLKLPNEILVKIVFEIVESECNGHDIISLNTIQDIGNAFFIENNNDLCLKIFSEIEKIKIENGYDIDVNNGLFNINIFSQQKYMILNEKVTKDVTIQFIKHMYKQQTGSGINVENIHFYSKSQLLQSNSTLESVNIIDNKNLITVKFGADGRNDVE